MRFFVCAKIGRAKRRNAPFKALTREDESRDTSGESVNESKKRTVVPLTYSIPDNIKLR